MFNINYNLGTKWQRKLIWLPILLLLAVMMSACGGQPEEVALSEQVPVRRGGTDTLAEVQEITAEILDIPQADVVEDANFREDLAADEDEMTRLADAFAQAFGVEISEEEVNEMTTVQSAVELIESK